MAEKVIIDLEVKSNKGVKNVEKLNTEISKTNKEVKKTNEELAGATNTLDKFTGGAVSKIKNFGSSIKGLTTGFKSLRVAIIGTGIGALLIALVSLRAAFTSSEEGQNKFAKLMGVIGSVTGNLVDMLANLGEGIINAFTNPKQALIDFKNLIVENITNRFNAIIDTLGFLGSAFKKVFSGDFKGALEDAKSAGSSYIDSLTGVEDSINKVTEATKGLVTELKEEAKIAGQIADQRAKADKLERALIVERAEANRKRAELLDKAANKEKFTAQERIDFLTEAGKIEEEITKKEIESARLRFEAKVEENKLSKSTKEDLDEEASLKARLIDLETARLTKAKLVTSQIVAAKREEKARLKAIEDEDKLRKEEEQKIQDEKDAERKKVLEEKEAERLREKESLANKEIELEAKKTAAKYKALNQLVGIFGAESKMGKAALIGKQLLAAQELLIDLGVIKSKATKTIAVANLDGAKSSSDVASGLSATLKLGFPAAIPALIGYGAAAVGIVSGVLAATKKTKSVASGLGGSGDGGGITPPKTPVIPRIETPTSQSLPPAFNVVGASGTSQLADAIGGQSQQPIQAYVVSNDVTTAQEMDRNIVTGASIG